ncbi:MAG TPA: hypothetical protein VJS30_30395, partial [Paraburkholderia sp.]|nr:hypothetical protein [Paraburkholderia sp.]
MARRANCAALETSNARAVCFRARFRHFLADFAPFFTTRFQTSPPTSTDSTMLIHPNLDPVAIHLGPLAVRWYGLMYLV